MNKRHTYFYIVLNDFSTTHFNPSLSNGYEFNVLFMITFSTTSHGWNSYGVIYV